MTSPPAAMTLCERAVFKSFELIENKLAVSFKALLFPIISLSSSSLKVINYFGVAVNFIVALSTLRVRPSQKHRPSPARINWPRLSGGNNVSPNVVIGFSRSNSRYIRKAPRTSKPFTISRRPPADAQATPSRGRRDEPRQRGALPSVHLSRIASANFRTESSGVYAPCLQVIHHALDRDFV
ncbi:hypothetical protein ALC60_13021 [Trachymyrmex zeteki]|uniref:Uncharacterized protein n=1 Tax=Mycetomoellerius zeteki TaxID=64791 RepID=A0A151WJQ6_9HYME|nr:hypothetical protein ALC60_13021 [Trachymyrmex zeteki]